MKMDKYFTLLTHCVTLFTLLVSSGNIKKGNLHEENTFFEI